jgi:hypothetical protein
LHISGEKKALLCKESCVFGRGRVVFSLGVVGVDLRDVERTPSHSRKGKVLLSAYFSIYLLFSYVGIDIFVGLWYNLVDFILRRIYEKKIFGADVSDFRHFFARRVLPCLP